MSRLLDEILSSKTLPPTYRADLQACVCIETSIVADYFYSHYSDEKWVLSKDFPNISPPFEHFFVEWKKNKQINSILRGISEVKKIGVRFKCREMKHLGEIPEYLITYLSGAKWFTAAEFYLGFHKYFESVFVLLFGIDEYGRWISDLTTGEPNYVFTPATDSDFVLQFFPFEIDPVKYGSSFVRTVPDDAKKKLISLICPSLLALSFMHCKKQTKLIEHIPPEKVQKKRERSKKPPLTKYYTLDIEPLKEILRTEGRVHEVGLAKALHICRGHFKDYSQGKGLFGKYQGLYWWDNHIRGNEEAGKIIKDYSVKLPEAGGVMDAKTDRA